MGLVPREDQVGATRHFQVAAADAARFERVDFSEQRRQVDNHAIGDHGYDVVVENATRNQLQGVLLIIDNDGMTGIVTALVAHHIGVLLGQQIDDLRLALVAPLGADDDGDGHWHAPRFTWTGTWQDSTGVDPRQTRSGSI